jgi:tRNA 2-thiouridine synthesizing protein A
MADCILSIRTVYCHAIAKGNTGNRAFEQVGTKSVDKQEQPADRDLDITTETCPMTFVRTRLALDRMLPGQLLRIRLKGAEPRANVPKTAAEQGHQVLALEDLADGTTQLLIRKG